MRGPPDSLGRTAAPRRGPRLLTALAALLAEYRDVTAERLASLATLQDSQLDDMGRGLFGESKVRSLLGIRVFDLWAHEQDIRLRDLGDLLNAVTRRPARRSRLVG